jgi:hypothetical protein
MNKVLHLRCDIVDDIAITFVHQFMRFSDFFLQFGEALSEMTDLHVEFLSFLPGLSDISSFLLLGWSCSIRIISFRLDPCVEKICISGLIFLTRDFVSLLFSIEHLCFIF